MEQGCPICGLTDEEKESLFNSQHVLRICKNCLQDEKFDQYWERQWLQS